MSPSGEARQPLSDPDYETIRMLLDCFMVRKGNSLIGLRYNGQSYYPATLHLLALVAAVDKGCGA